MSKFLTFPFLLFTFSFAFADTKDPVAPFDSYYGTTMKSTEEYTLVADWQIRNADALAAATAEDVLAGFVANDASAFLLLAKVKGAYDTDPIACFQIAAVSQWVMGEEPCFLCFWKPSPAAGRKVWVKALVARAETANDTYVKLFCLDQLRWCGCKCPCVLERIKAIGDKSGDKAVKDMVDIVLRTLNN